MTEAQVAPDQTVRWQMEVYADSTVELHGLAVGNDNVYAVGVSYGRAKSANRSTFFAVPPGILSVPCKTNTAKCTVVRVGSE